MRVSVLMPTFNQAHFLSHALERLLAQTFSDWELLIVDDGSSDSTREVLAAWTSHQQFHYHRLNQNRGFAAALNFALDRARGDLIAYLPSDDFYYREHLSSLVQYLDAHPDVVLACSGIRYKQRMD